MRLPFVSTAATIVLLANSPVFAQESIRVDVNLVTLSFSVRDLDNLTKDDFDLIEDTVPQKIAHFAAFRIEDTTSGPSHTLIASVLWEFAAASTNHKKSLLRMTIVFAWKDAWAILLAQVTPVASLNAEIIDPFKS